MHWKGLSNLGCLAVGLLAAGPALAAPTVFTVDSPAQSDSAGDLATNCTLGDALVAANGDAAVDGCVHPNVGSGGPFEIVLPPASGPYVLSGSEPGTNGRVGLPVVRASVTVVGNGNVLERDSALSCPDAAGNDFRLMEVANGARLVVDSLTMQNGCAPSSGGIHNAGQLLMSGVTLAGNTATSGHGGGLGNERGNAELVDSLVSDNQASRDGGGIYNARNAVLVLNRSTVVGNGAAAGGGIENMFAQATLMNSTVSTNDAANGGGISNSGGAFLTLLNSTVAGNTAGRGPGLLNRNGSMSYANSLLADRCLFERSPGTPDAGNNLERWNGCGLTAATSIVNVSTGIAALADVGGPTPTHPLRVDSPGIDAGDPATCALAGIDGADQRGVPRASIDVGSGTGCDIGAVEFVDCDASSVDDGSEIGANPGLDADGNGVLDACEDQPPVAVAGEDQVLECSSDAGASASLDGSASSDPEGAPLAYAWTGPFGTATGATADVMMPVGSSAVSLEVADPAGNTASDSVQLTVEDTATPTATAGLERIAMNGAWDDLRVQAGCSDVCDAGVVAEAVFDGISVSDGETVQVRGFEDAGAAPVLTVRCVDASGNAAEATAAAPVREPVVKEEPKPKSPFEQMMDRLRSFWKKVQSWLSMLFSRWF
jgi:hypothetical protein